MDSIKRGYITKQISRSKIAKDLIETDQDYQDYLMSKNSCKSKRASKGEYFENFGNKKTETEDNMGKVKEINESSKASSEGLWEKFAKTTTGHGFARMVDENEPLKFRIFWAVAVILLATGLLTSVLIVSYNSLVVKELRREFSVKHNLSLNLPNIHICDTTLFNATILKEMGFNNSLASYLALALSPHLASYGLRHNHQRRQDLENEYRRLMKNRTMHEVFDKAVLKCENFVLGCTHDGIPYSSTQCCNRFFGTQRYLTDLATLCFSTRNQTPIEELFVSQIYGFTVYLKTSSHSRFEFDQTIISSNVASRRGIIYAVSDRITAVNPAISTLGHYAKPGTWTSASISLTRTDNSELADGLLSPYSCALPEFHSSLVRRYGAYSRRNCFFGISHSASEAKFNCSRFRFNKKRISVTCEPKVMVDAYSADIVVATKHKAETCPKDCISDDYHISASTTDLYVGDHDDMNIRDIGIHDDSMVYSAIHFFYPSFSFDLIKNHPQSIVKWLSEVGGNMSLFVGASFVTLIEITLLIIKFVRFYIPRERQAA